MKEEYRVKKKGEKKGFTSEPLLQLLLQNENDLRVPLN